MSRKNDVDTLVAASKKQWEGIRGAYEQALRDKSLDLRVRVKNLMENLRSALDYIAHDIYDACCRRSRDAAGEKHPDRIYFPYGVKKNDFDSMVGKHLPGLAKLAPAVYAAVESIQLFKNHDSWLTNLCSILNESKHDRLTPQVRAESQTHTAVSDHGSVTIPVNNPNVRVASLPGAVKVFGVPAEFGADGIRTAPSDKLKHVRTTWVAFTFAGTNVNVLDLLERAVPGVADLTAAVYRSIR